MPMVSAYSDLTLKGLIFVNETKLSWLCGPKGRRHASARHRHTHGTPRHAPGTPWSQGRRATTTPPICLGVPPLCHPYAYGMPALCLGPPLFAPSEARTWRAHGLSLTFAQPSLFAVAMLPTPKPMQLGPQKLNYCCSQQVDC